MTLLQRFKQSSISNQGNLIIGGVVMLATVAIMIATVANSVAVVFQYRAAKSNATDASRQTSQLIQQAQLQAAASQQSAQAAMDFSTSARSINSEIGNAVDKLGHQAAASQRIADVTIAASNASVRSIYLSTKPYVLPVLSPSEVPGGCSQAIHRVENGYCISLQYQNFGQTPALNVQAFGFVQVMGRSTKPAFPLAQCEGSTKSVLAKDEADSCQIRIPRDDAQQLQFITPMPGSAYLVRGYITFDDVYGKSDEQEFCNYYPLNGPSLVNRARTCKLSGDLDSMRPATPIRTQHNSRGH